MKTSGVGDAGGQKISTATELLPTKIAEKNQAKVRPRDRAAAAVLELLVTRWPACFSIFEQHRRPLKIGIHRDIIAALDGALSKKSLRRAMRSYVGNEMYRERLVVGAVRVDLDGQPAGIVTREQTPPYWKTEKPIDEKPAAPRRLGPGDLRRAAQQRKAEAAS